MSISNSPFRHSSTSTLLLLLSFKMCKHEIIGDFYRGCGHFHGRYFTGECFDCGSESCRTSRNHSHRAENCGCDPDIVEDRRIQNIFQIPHSDCQRMTR